MAEIYEMKVMRKFYQDGDFRIELDDFDDLLDSLESSDAYFAPVVIYREDARSYLENKGVISTNARGASYLLNEELLKDLQQSIKPK
jgi:hypothetical protein